MALPQSVVDRLTQEPVGTPGWSRRLLLFSLTILLFTVFVYAGLQYGYLPYLKGEVTRLDGEIKKFNDKVPAENQEKIISFYSQLSNLKTLLANHDAVTRVLSWLERNTFAGIQYTRLAFTAQSRQLSLSGIARRADDATNQLAVFQNSSAVARAAIGSLTAEASGVWRFDLSLVLTPEFLAAHPAPSTAVDSNATPATTSTTP